jgi:hypothetical protein
MNQKFSIINSSLCISVDALAEALGGDESAYNTVKRGLYNFRKNQSSYYTNHPDPSDHRRRWIVLDSLPPQPLQALRFHYPDPHLYYYSSQFSEALDLCLDPADSAHLYSLVRSGFNITPQRIDDYCRSAAWLRLLAALDLRSLFSSSDSYYRTALTVINSMQIPTFKISNVRVLQRKLKSWKYKGIDSLISNKYNNSNSQKINEIQIKFIINLYSQPIKLTISEVWRQYNIQAEHSGWQIISEERCRQIINDPANRQLWMISRDGTLAARNVLERTIRRRRPSFPDALWTLDGLTVQLRYKAVDGSVRSDLYAVVILDANSDRVVGWSFGTTETGTLVQAALRSAGRNTMMLPYQIQYDNSSANISTEVDDLMKRLSRVHFPTQPYNGKSKMVENFIGRLESYFLRHFHNFKGGNITAKSLQVRANPDYLESLRKNNQLPTVDGARAQFELAIRAFNATRGERDGMSPDERYKIAHPERRKMDYLTIVDAYWVTRREQVRYTKDGLTIQVDRQRYTYEVESDQRGIEDMNFRRKYLGDRFTVKYDPDDLTCLHLYQDDTWIAMASQKYEAPMAIADYQDGEGSIVSEALKQRRQYLQTIQDDHAAIVSDLKEEGLPVDLDFNLLHKDAYNRIEGRILDDLLTRSAVAPVRSKTKKTVPIDLYSDEEADGSVIEINY